MHFGRSSICLIVTLLLLIPSGICQTTTNYKSLYERAERLSNAADHTDQTDAAALKMYQQVVDYLTKVKTDNQFLFKADVSTGAFLQVLGRQRESINSFKNALTLKTQLPDLKDSVLFRPLVYCGNAYYTFDKLDTAEIFYKRASAVADRFPAVGEQERLYNTLGVISYSKGNYNESIPFYQKAISTLKAQRNYDRTLLVVYESNLASAFRKLRRYEEALNIYLSLLPYKLQTDQILHNIAAAYLGMGADGKAISYLSRVSYENQKKLNDLALAYLHKKDYVQSLNYLAKAKELNFSINKMHKNSDYGITLKYWGDLFWQQKQPRKALPYYQEAIANLLANFNFTSYYTNPSNFKSAFNGVELLETLSAKAQAFEGLYQQTHQLRDLEASLNTYSSFYSLADYIARFYETDESRLLISNRKYISRDEPINICIRLFRATGDRKYIEKAFALDEENKAGVLSMYLDEATRKRQTAPPQLLQDEAGLKEAITRISLKAASETDAAKLQADQNEINDLAVKLFKIRESISQKTGFTNNSGPGISVSALQKIIPADGAVLSYHVGEYNLTGFAVTRSDFNFFITSIGKDFLGSVKDMYRLAGERESNSLRQIKTLGQSLYKTLIKPVESEIDSKQELVIIPDNSLNFLPFELLIDEDGNRLLNAHALVYNYSCKILQKNSGDFSSTVSKLGMAPFTAKTDSTTAWSELPSSAEEVQALNGVAMVGRDAVKTAFLQNAGKFEIIHLATHAVANDLHPDQSFIAFYPAKPDSELTYKLYMPEIYNLQLDKTRLIVLSACESGAGELARGEGIMSLSRAFSYSGCDNIITSMWKADDRSTAYLSKRLYSYLDKGFAIAGALRQAKLDYLNDNHIGMTQKIPGYWAHLRLIGTFGKAHVSNQRWIWYTVILFGIICLIVLIKKGRLHYRRPGVKQT